MKRKNDKGITLLALVITIIVLLILAGITISAITGDNGIIGNAEKAKEEAEIANEKEIVEKATVQAMGNNKYGNIEENELQSELDKETGEGKTEATNIGDEFEIIFNDSNRYYTVDKDGNVGEAQDIIEDKNPGDITVGKDGETLDGTEEKPYEIWCIEDLVVFSNMVNGTGIRLENGNPVEITTGNSFSGKYIELKANLNFKSKLSYQDSERTDFGDINGVENDGNTLINEMITGSGFQPIGRFSGIFDGNDYQICNLYENRNNTNLGLFGTIKDATIKNITVEGRIQSENQNNSIGVGGIVGYIPGSNDATLFNCNSNVNIETKTYGVGGIVGRTFGNIEITNCSNLGKITNSSESTGGIIGRNEGTTTNIFNSFNIGEISSIGQQAGGIIGYCVNNTNSTNITNITNVYNYGEISRNGAYGRGGIVGGINIRNTDNGIVNINNTYNIGKVIDQKVNWLYGAGGICGYRYDVSKSNLIIDNSYYLRNTCSVAVGNEEDSQYGVTQVESLTNEELKNYLNMYIQTENQQNWKKWKLGEEGYPIFE